MNRLKLSVIVPVYNAEKYIRQCVESIMNQRINSMEVILIDDGSTDTSGRLCDKYAEQYEGIKVIHQKNQGVIESRKKGVESAEAEYVTFVDSDDWIDGEMFREFIHIAESADGIDLVISGLLCDKGGICFRRSGSILPGIYDVAKNQIVQRMFYDWEAGEVGLAGYACGKLLRRDLLLKVIKTVDKKIVHGEDYAWFYSYVPLARKIAVTDRLFYHYRMHTESTSTSFDLESFTQLLELKNFFNVQVERGHMSKDNIAGINQLVWGGLMHALREIYGLSVGYIFPYELVNVGSRVVIYGAGVVGKCYYNCLKSGSYAEIKALVDKKGSGITEAGYVIHPPEYISKISYDVVVVAVEPEELYQSIKEELRDLGVDEKKVIWSKPKILRT